MTKYNNKYILYNSRVKTIALKCKVIMTFRLTVT